MKKISLSVESLSKVFNRRLIFKNIAFSLSERQSLAVTGRNGSGKSTLAKIVCGLLSPSAGRIVITIDGTEIDPARTYQHVGLVSPYVMMYDEFSGMENLAVISRIRGLRSSSEGDAEQLLKTFGIYERRNDEVRTYSSGMKQRLKYAAALLHHPEILVLDEPAANLDEEGIGAVRTTMRAQCEDGILMIATNDKEDLEFAQNIIDLNRNGTGSLHQKP
jgi:heme exporter protein A